MTDEQLVPVFIPPLVKILAQLESQNGKPLTEDEVIAIRDQSVVMMMRISAAKEMSQQRGYRDINPQNCWEDWQKIRVGLLDDDSN
jgi:hypothetical protein